jgi:acyl-lipid omega-6 desaturase (Delta-12 desaturase)
MSSTSILKQKRHAIILEHARANDVRALSQVLTTLMLLAIVWWAAIWSIEVSIWLTAGATVLIALFTMRVFSLMHECGHGSLFRRPRLNRTFGFLLGVLTGMPQYVWSQHHSFHHANNGNCEKYRGPYTTLSVDEYSAMTKAHQRVYRGKYSILLAPFAGFIYLIFNPRFTWLKGSIEWLGHVARCKLARPDVALKVHAASFETHYWISAKQYWHMLWNNVALLSVWTIMCWVVGAMRFTPIYLISLSLAGGVGILLFTVQHNFRHSYASDTRNWDYDRGAIDGTSFLVLPRWLNWFTANIGYHHIHHLSARIPNYRLVGCHDQYRSLFADVTRVKLSQVPKALKYILWDERAQRIISIEEF